jgi:hypothetical protein
MLSHVVLLWRPFSSSSSSSSSLIHGTTLIFVCLCPLLLGSQASILLGFNRTQQWRHSYFADYVILDIASQQWKSLVAKDEVDICICVCVYRCVWMYICEYFCVVCVYVCMCVWFVERVVRTLPSSTRVHVCPLSFVFCSSILIVCVPYCRPPSNSRMHSGAPLVS